MNAHYLREQLAAAGQRVVDYRLIKDEPEQVAGVLDELASGAERKEPDVSSIHHAGVSVGYTSEHPLKTVGPDDRIWH